jgi:hypothetical protein
LVAAISHVGSYGFSSNILKDYVSIDYDSILINSNSQDVQLLFYYIPIGTQNNPQYKIVSASVKAANEKNVNAQTLFIEYVELDFTVTLNVPNPPTINAYLPDDFLYPFYVAG